MPKRTSTLHCEARLYVIERRTVLRLPQTASRKLPSRGQVAVEGRINGRQFQTVLEPDGSGGHWMRLDARLRRAADVSAGDAVRFDIEPSENWPEPMVPRDMQVALNGAPQKVRDLWNDITPMARWEWIRWINATRNSDTRRRRVEVSLSKMDSGKRRPCCFNLAACTDPELSSNGKLLEPSTVA